MNLPGDIEGVRALAERLAREHVAAGGQVAGYVTPYVPAALIEAAGMQPMMLNAGQETSTELGDRVMEDLFDASVRGIFERLLKSEFDYLSAIVLPRANDSAHRLYYYLSELKRTGEARLPPVLLCDVAMTPDEASRTYSIDALGKLWRELRAIGTKATEEDIRAAIRLSNRRTEVLREYAALRRSGGVGGAEALAVFAAARMLRGDMVESAVAERMRAGAKDSPATARIIVCGSAQHDAGLHKLIESAGGAVVGDHHAAGELSVSGEIDDLKAPLEALADCARNQENSRAFTNPALTIVQFAQACGATAAIFSYFPEEEALTWDFPTQREALEATGVRVLRLADQRRPFDATVHRTAVTAFLRGGG